jgi:conjugal transfer pilus assembly protein TraA
MLTKTKKYSLWGLVAAMFAAFAPEIMASTTGAEFQGIYDMIVAWANGYLGRTLAILAFVIGLGLGVARSTPIPAIAGLVFALFVAFGPGIIDGIVTATV